jgi:hypothetical protein
MTRTLRGHQPVSAGTLSCQNVRPPSSVTVSETVP